MKTGDIYKMIIKHSDDKNSAIWAYCICDLCDKEITLVAYTKNPIEKTEFDKKVFKPISVWSYDMKELAKLDHIEQMVIELEKLIRIIGKPIQTMYYLISEEMILKEGAMIINDKHICKSCWEAAYKDKDSKKAARQILRDLK